MHEDLVPPESIEGKTDKEINVWKTEYDVCVTLKEMGHEILPVGVAHDLGVLRDAIFEFKPHITFNLLEEFHGVAVYDQHVVSYLELMKRRYTGCNPRGLMLAHDKALSKKILSFHRVPVPDFAVFEMGRRIRPSSRLRYPMLVKSLTEEGSVGIAQASVVADEEQLRERAEFVHRQLATDAIAEQFIEGRELYVGVLGNRRLETLPVWELTFDKMTEDRHFIATSKVKWDLDYQKKWGIRYDKAKEIPADIEPRLNRICKRAYRALNISGYARMDLRLTPDNELYLLEANPNPQLSYGDEFAESAESAGMSYDELLQRILNLGRSYRAQWQD
ncbi:MAG: ATP-grasp domain-containing protein [bacterium]|nr:ATP-grasp domain-containing protein [bacterium]